jgi:hypothetical protein
MATKIKMSGWNLFVRVMMTDATFKTQFPDHTARLKAIGPIWKAMSQEEKDVWKAKAETPPPWFRDTECSDEDEDEDEDE